MANIAPPMFQQMDVEQEEIVNQLFAEMQRLNEHIQQDQADIDRLTAETRVISVHSERLLTQIEAQLNLLCRAA